MKREKLSAELNFLASDVEIERIRKLTLEIVNEIKSEIKKQKVDADVFIGGSFAKGTLIGKKEYDVDLFVRFGLKYDFLSFILEKIVKKVCNKIKIPYIAVHGSRDYFRAKKGNTCFEIIPVLRIKRPNDAKNVTDLSYFHVNYVKKNINKKIANEIAVAKAFCKAQGVYGAESYIQGFSGYALECLIIYYKSFEKMLKAMVKVKNKLIIDQSKKYKNTNEILINLNESRLKSPIVLIDPTWKERNVLAALSAESFQRFQRVVAAFLKNKSSKFFKESETDVGKLKNEAKIGKNEFLYISLQTNKQAGDIAGTKLKKFYNFICSEIEHYYEIKKKEFIYDELHSAEGYLILRCRGEILKRGPPSGMKEACKKFKKVNKIVFVKKGFLYSKIKNDYSAKRFLTAWGDKYAKKVKEMDITEFRIA